MTFHHYTQTQVRPSFSIYPIVTRSKTGIFKPKEYKAFIESLIETLNTLLKALANLNYKQAIWVEFDAFTK